jgi:hypothetical protein
MDTTGPGPAALPVPDLTSVWHRLGPWPLALAGPSDVTVGGLGSDPWILRHVLRSRRKPAIKGGNTPSELRLVDLLNFKVKNPTASGGHRAYYHAAAPAPCGPTRTSLRLLGCGSLVPRAAAQGPESHTTCPQVAAHWQPPASASNWETRVS